MKPAQQKEPQSLRQTTMALDGKRLWGMTAAERDAALGALASLLLEASGVPAKEARDERG
jgi:hypothetical protein